MPYNVIQQGVKCHPRGSDRRFSAACQRFPFARQRKACIVIHPLQIERFRMEPMVAIYARVSSKQQDLRSQEPDLKRWAEVLADGPVKWYTDKATGRTMDRPGWKRLESDLAIGKVSKVVVWRLDRLGRTAAGLTALFEDLQRRGVGFESLRDKIDLSTASGRLMANVLASVAAYENEVRSERIVAGQAVARANGKRWGGSKKGRHVKVTKEQEAAIKQLRFQGAKIAAIARTTGLSRPTVYSVLGISLEPKAKPEGGTTSMS